MLSEKTAKEAKPTDKPQKLPHEKGLYLYISPKGGKSWRFDYRFADKRCTLTLGQYPEVSFVAALNRHHDAKIKLAEGINPAQAKKIAKHELKTAQKNTFDEVAKAWYDSKADRRSAVWRDTHNLYLKRDLSPVLGNIPLPDITQAVLLGALTKAEERSGVKTADRVRQTAVQVFDYGVRKLKVSANLPRLMTGWAEVPPKMNRPWLKENELPGFFDALEAYPGYLTTKGAARLLFLTLVRKKELVQAKWSEFDLDEALWVVPPERMKMPTEQKENRHNAHDVPLSRQALELLKELKPISSGSEYLFPSNSSLEKPMSPSTLNMMFQRMGFAGLLSPHGIRATASTILNERGYNSDYIEKQLAHVERNSVRGAYNHAKYLAQRRVMMQEWADYLDELRQIKPKGNQA